MTGTDRGVSTTLGYVLTLAITTLLVSGLLVATGGFVETQRDDVIREELTVVGHTVAAKIEGADRLAITDGTTGVRIGAEIPASIGGSTYLIDVAPGGADAVRLQTNRPNVSVTVSVAASTDLVESTVPGGSVVVEYDAAADELEVTRD